MGGRCWNLPTWDNYAFCVEERIPPSFLEAIFVKECFLFIFYSISGSNYPATEFPACKSEAIHVLGCFFTCDPTNQQIKLEDLHAQNGGSPKTPTS